MAIPTCKVCGAYMLPSAAGRPATTCSPTCRREWKAARQRAQRARARALEQLGLALGALTPICQPWETPLRAYYRRLLNASPGELACINDKSPDWPPGL